MNARFVLASASPRRRDLLSKLDIPFEVCPSTVDEDFQAEDEPEDIVRRFSLEKARQVASRFPDRIVIGADTVVVLGNEILGKPRNLPEAKEMLGKLSGSSHTVLTAVALVRQNANAEHTLLEKTEVTFFRLRNEMVDYYVSNYRPLDKAGAYGIQDWSVCFVKSISGCYNNVVGFPLARFARVISDPIFGDKFGIDNWLGKVDDKS